MAGPRLNPRLLEVPLYVAGRPIEEVQAELGLDEVIKLASNESPIGPSPMAVEAARQALDLAHRYPGVADRDLRRKLADHLGPGIDEQCFVIGNGGTDILHMITQAFVFDGGNTVMSRASFPMYRISTITFGGTPRQVKPAPDYSQDLDAMPAHVDDDTRIVFLCSPNNPTGYVIAQDAADRLLDRLPDHVVAVFDESYRDYVTDPGAVDSLAYVREGRNVLSVHSFSKNAGLANVRVGYLVAPPEIADYVRHTQLPFHTGTIALAAAAASLDDRDFQARNREAVLEGRAYLHSALRELGLRPLPSQSNFLTVVDPPMAPEALTDALLRRGIIVRAMAGFGLPNGFRMAVGSPEENAKAIHALRQILDEEVVRRPAP